MGRFLDALKAGFKTASEPAEYTIADKQIRCPHCGETTFFTRQSLLDTRGLSVVDLEWLNPSATVLICAECGRIEWFAHQPAEMPRG